MAYDRGLFGQEEDQGSTDPYNELGYLLQRQGERSGVSAEGGDTGAGGEPLPFDPTTDQVVAGSVIILPTGKQFRYRTPDGVVHIGFIPNVTATKAAAAPKAATTPRAATAATGGAAAANPLTPPGLDPSRARIVAYLQALLGQNALPYNAVGGGGAATPSVAAPPAVPALTAPPSLAAPALGGGQTMVNVAGAPSPIDISGGAFAQQPQNFLSALNPAQSAPRTFAPPQIGTPLAAPQMAAPLPAPAPTPYPQDLLRNKLPGLY